VTDIDELQKKLKAFADTVNLFKSEAVQLRVVDALLGRLGVPEEKVAPASRSRSTSKARRRGREKTSDPSSQSQARAPRKSSRGSGSPGASAAISDLLASGFFKAPKTIGQIVEHCASARGHRYKANECSPPLLRLLRDGKLERKKNKDGQYEYTQV
jgi:hypothetical protein